VLVVGASLIQLCSAVANDNVNKHDIVSCHLHGKQTVKSLISRAKASATLCVNILQAA